VQPTRAGASVGANLCGRREPLTPADRRHPQMERRMARMPAFVDQRFRGFVAHPDLYQLFSSAVRFSEMSAEPALPVVYVLHRLLPRPREAKTVLPSQTAESTKLGLPLYTAL
jgi:hypothetical protein